MDDFPGAMTKENKGERDHCRIDHDLGDDTGRERAFAAAVSPITTAAFDGNSFLSQPYQLDFHQVHFTEAYAGICDIPPVRLKELYREINQYFYGIGTPALDAGV